MVKITLPLPPTDNRRLVKARYGNRLISTKQYRHWYKVSQLAWEVNHKDFPMIQASYEHQVEIKYKLFLKDKRSDMQNYEKSLRDFLSKRLYNDDKWVKLDLQLPVLVSKQLPRVEIIIE